MITHRSRARSDPLGPFILVVVSRPQGGLQMLAITHIFPCEINILAAFPQGRSFCAEPFEGFHLE
jgi:hypothetical protein